MNSSNATLRQLAYGPVLGSAARTALSGAPANDPAWQTQQRLFAEVYKLDAVPQKKEKNAGNDEVGSNTTLASDN